MDSPHPPSRLSKCTLGVAWFTVLVSPITLIIGHMGARGLSWKKSHVSAYAAWGPHDDWVTATMVLAAIGLVSIGLGLRRTLGRGVTSGLISVLLCAAAVGLGIVARYELGSGVVDFRRHNIGLVIFLCAATAGLVVAGGVVLVRGVGWARRLGGLWMVLCAGASVAAMRTNWTSFRGVRQRGAFLCLWLGALLFLAILSSRRKVPVLPT